MGQRHIAKACSNLARARIVGDKDSLSNTRGELRSKRPRRCELAELTNSQAKNILSMETAALATRSVSRCPAAAAPAHGHRGASATVARRAPCGRLRALPPELSEILSPKLVPGSPSDTGDVSSLIPVSALMLLLYFVTNWVVPELIMKRLQPKADDQEASAAASMSFSGDATDGQTDGEASGPKIRLKVKKKKKKNKNAPVKV